MSELQSLLDQLDELLVEGAVDPDDALEIATVAGLAARLGADRHPSVEAAIAWKQSGGADLLVQAFENLDVEELLSAIDGLIDGESADEAIEEAVYDFDDAVAASIWAGHPRVLKEAADALAQTIRDIPEPFACLSDYGKELSRLASVAQHLDLYDYWLAIADSAPPSED